MRNYTYVIVGGGMAADAAAEGIRAADPAGTLGVISGEPHPPYNRPPLSKGLWKGEPEDSIWRKAAQAGGELHLGRRAVGIDLGARTVTDDRGAAYGFKKLLLATGGAPRRLPLQSDQVIYFRTLDDYRRLRGLAEQRLRFAVIGGGFIGSEVAAALRMQDRDVTMLVPEAGPGARVFPADLSRFLVDYYRAKGVELRTQEGMAGLGTRGGKCVVRTTTQGELVADVIVAGLGIQPSVELAEQAGLLVENGIVVDELCRTTVIPTSTPRATSRTSTPLRSAPASAWSTKTTPTPWGRSPGRTWRGARRPTFTSPFSTRICSSSAMRRSGTWTRGWKRWRTGRRHFGKVWSTTSRTGACAASCCGTPGGRSITRGR